MTMKELRRYKRSHCFHSCYHCEYKDTCWKELGVEQRKPFPWKTIIQLVVIPLIIGFLVMFWLINIICAGFMM